MTDREKLVNILKTEACPYPYLCDEGCRYVSLPRCFEERYADHLLANGVTFATDNTVGGKWIPVTERLPDPFEVVLVYDSTAKRIEYAYMTRHREWVGVVVKNEVTHWMPLPEPPKEGE